MRLDISISIFAALSLVFGAVPKMTAAESTETLPNEASLLRVQFAGTTALLADTNAAYLTNFAPLPATAAFSKHLAARFATLPGKFLSSGKSTSTNSQAPLPDTATLLQPIFAELLQTGFTLELHGDGRGVHQMALAAQTSPSTAQEWNHIWKSAAQNWFSSEQAPPAADKNWTAGGGKLRFQQQNGWTFLALGKTDARVVMSAIEKTCTASPLVRPELLHVELASTLIPGPIQRSVYGGFKRLELSLYASNQNLSIRGTAVYEHDLPTLGSPPPVPAELITEPVLSFTLVREPGSWLEPASPLRRFFPKPFPNTAYFWGSQSSPYELFMVLPFPDRKEFITNYAPMLKSQLVPVAKYIDSGSVTFDPTNAVVNMQTVPFVTPKISYKTVGTNGYIYAEAFPQMDGGQGLTPGLLERVSNRTNLVLYDWEYTQLRFDTSVQIGLLALYCSNHEQHLVNTPSYTWAQTMQTNVPFAINTTTEITQTGPRELTLKRSAPLALTSLEFFWLANWFESSKFPSANFLIPLPVPTPPTETPKEN